MRRFTMAAAIVFAGALALTGCTGEAAEDLGDEVRESVEAQVSESAAALKDAACELVTARIQEIAADARTQLEATTEETAEDVEAFFDDASAEVDDLLASVENQEVADAIEGFAEEVRLTAEYRAGLSDPGAANEDEIAELQQDLQDAADEVASACEPDEE